MPLLGNVIGTKVHRVQRGLRYGDFGYHSMLKVESSNFLVMTQQCMSLPDETRSKMC
jgi:hypothetical protein